MPETNAIQTSFAFLPRLILAGRFAAARDVNMHTHTGTELVLVTAGVCRIAVGRDHRLLGKKGSLFVLPGGKPHDQKNAGFARTSYVEFLAQPEVFDETPRVVQVPTGDPANRWLENLCDLKVEAEPADPMVTGGLLLALLTRLNAQERKKYGQRAIHPNVLRALAHLQADMMRPYAASALAARAGVSVSHLNALFRRHVGCSPLRYLQELRLKRARNLLQTPYARVREVSAACGYEDANYFVRLFSRRFGISPGRWRRRHGPSTFAHSPRGH